jgi:predicted MPP superfamily phosphohydrolase
VDLSSVLLVCAIAAGLSGGFAARYRRWGTALADVTIGVLVAGLFSVVALVVLSLAADLDRFGVVHFVYLLAVVGFPLASAWIVIPHLLDAEHRTPFIGWLLILSSVALVAAGLWATHVEPFRLQVDEQILGVTGSTEPIVVGVISDLQTTAIGSHERAALDAVLEGNPDVVVLPGDLFQLDLEDIGPALPEFIGWLRTLTSAVEHVVLVNGNTDDAEIVEDIAEETGATYLDDELVELTVRGQVITVLGLSVSADRDRRDIDADLLEQLRTTTRRQDLVLAVSHYPDPVLSLTPGTTIDLILSGHTHGGQVALPRLGPLVTASDVPRVVAAGGLHVVDGHPIYVSTGVGLERGQAPQLRFGVPPSVALITIVPA